MDKPMNRIKEVLEERSIKQTWLAEKEWKKFLHRKFLCMQSPSTESGWIVRNS